MELFRRSPNWMAGCNAVAEIQVAAGERSFAKHVVCRRTCPTFFVVKYKHFGLAWPTGVVLGSNDASIQLQAELPADASDPHRLGSSLGRLRSNSRPSAAEMAQRRQSCDADLPRHPRLRVRSAGRPVAQSLGTHAAARRAWFLPPGIRQP